MTWNGSGPKHRPVYDNENQRRQKQLDAIDNLVTAFTEDDTQSLFGDLWRGIKAALTLVGSIALVAALTITIWKALNP